MERFLSERLTYDQANIQVVTEAPEFEGAPKQLYMNGIFIQGGVKNLNERVYPVQEIRRAVDNVNKFLIKVESVWGKEVNPEELNINLNRASNMITKRWMDGPNG